MEVKFQSQQKSHTSLEKQSVYCAAERPRTQLETVFKETVLNKVLLLNTFSLCQQSNEKSANIINNQTSRLITALLPLILLLHLSYVYKQYLSI